MYYDNGNYMQDLNYYNQNPVQNFGYNPYIMNNFQNHQFPMGMSPQNQQNLRAMYPASYRIICPVASQVVANSNIQYITDDGLNKMVDTVYNIVEGDINLTENSNTNSNEPSTESTQGSNFNRNTNSNSSSKSTSNTTGEPNRQNSLLRDLIKIIILNEIINRRQNQAMMMQNNMQNFNMNQQMF